MVVCYPEAVEEAKKENLTLDEKIWQLVEHGLMHLLGYHIINYVIMSLYLKYRPQRIAELDLGDVREILDRMVKGGKIPQAILWLVLVVRARPR